MKKKKSKRTLTPKLRFPEFRSSGKWKSDRITEVATISKGRGISKADVTEGGTTPCIRYAELYTQYGEVIHEVRSRTNISPDELVLSEAEDVILPASGETRADIATAACVMREGVALGGDLNILRADLHGPFFSYLLNSPLRYKIARVAQGDTVAHLYPSQISKISIAVPSPPEQQRIAECLSSLDGLIAAGGRMLQVLKAHKKGLMQQLFPQPGQTQPRLRFPEFRDKGAWTSEKLGRICKFVRGPFGGALKKEIFVPVGYAVYEQSHAIHKDLDTFRYYIDEAKYIELKRFAVKPNDIIMSCSGTMGKFAVLSSKPTPGVINQALLKLSVDKKYDLGFVAIALVLPGNRSRLLAQSAGGAIKNIVGVKLLKEIEISVPAKQEQRRIADCLTALDTRIAAQAAKIDALKQHKRGLMQQLFPAPEEQ